MIRAALIGALAVVLGSCSVNDYCLNCATGDAGVGDAPGDAHDASVDAPDAATCIPTGVEVCDGKDNDCDGTIDEEVAGVGDACANQMGACAGGKQVCTNGVLKCDKPPMPEICDGIDNNCNGMVDEGDPGGGGICGTNVGECTAGVNHCNLTTHVVECTGAIGTVGGQMELCNGRDDDCDGSFDEGITSLGACGGAPGANPTVGNCHPGSLMCVGGGTICVGDQGPLFEACDNMDNDCDGNTDEDYDKTTDPQNCGACGHVCSVDHAIAGCAPSVANPGGDCTVASCQAGYHDNNVDPSDGCEYGPCNPDGAEVCDGVDNDCDGKTDAADPDLTAPVGLCKTIGACAGSFATCDGANGWKCVYPSGTASVDANGNLIAETTCDGIDNDCDGKVDENQPNLGDDCHDNKLGACQSTGHFKCDDSNVAGGSLDGPAVCDFANPGVGTPADHEDCNGIDDDCDGIVDNTTGAHRVIDSMSHVVYGAFDFYIDKYEASRPDATASVEGLLGARACSNPSVIPWGNLSWDAASAACVAAGKVLCTGVQWGAACEGATNTTFPYGNAFGASTCNTESNDGIPGGADDDVLIATGAKAACAAAAGAVDLSGNLREWTDDKTGTAGGKNIEVLRGGSYLTPAAGATCDFRTSRAAQNVLEQENGFRCCRATAP